MFTTDVAVPTQPAGSATVMSVFGWIVIHQHIGDGFDWNLSWADYRNGFGSTAADFWLGLESMYRLTSSQAYRLRVEVQEEDAARLWYSAEYWSFTVSGQRGQWWSVVVDNYESGACMASTGHSRSVVGVVSGSGQTRVQCMASTGHSRSVVSSGQWWSVVVSGSGQTRVQCMASTGHSRSVVSGGQL